MIRKIVFTFVIILILLPWPLLAKVDLKKIQEEVNVVEEVDGDAMLLGETINVTEEISGDLLAVGRDIIVTAPVGQDFRAAGANMLINSLIYGNVTLLGTQIVLGKLGNIQGNLYVLGGLLDLQGEVKGDVIFKGDVVQIAGQVNGDVNLGTISKLNIKEGAKIFGDLSYQAKRPLVIPKEFVAGSIIYQPLVNSWGLFWQKINWFWQLVWFFAAVAFGLILINFFESQVKKINILMVQKPGKSILIGLVFTFIIPLASLLLLVTMIGIPLGVFVLAVWLLFLYIAPLLVATIIGKLCVYGCLKNKKRLNEISMLWFLIVGLLLLQLFFMVPWIGGVFKIFVVFWGLGGSLLFIKNTLFTRN